MIGFKTSHNMLQVGRVGYKTPCLFFLKIIRCHWNRYYSYKPHGSYKAISCWNKPKKGKLRPRFQNEENKKVWDKQINNPHQYYTEQPWPRKKEHSRLSDKIMKNNDLSTLNWHCCTKNQERGGKSTYNPFRSHFKHVTIKILGQGTRCLPKKIRYQQMSWPSYLGKASSLQILLVERDILSWRWR